MMRRVRALNSVASGTFPLNAGSSEAIGLPKTTVLVGVADPRPETFTMTGMAINPHTGTVVGTMPSGGSRGMPLSSISYGYATRGEDGGYFEFHPLTDDHRSGHSIFLNSADQILLQQVSYPSAMDPTYSTRLIDLKTGVETPLQELLDPEFWGRYGRMGVRYLTDRGDIVLMAVPRVDSGVLESPEAETFILTPPGVAAPMPIPEPSLLWLAAGAIALGWRARSRRTGRPDAT